MMTIYRIYADTQYLRERKIPHFPGVTEYSMYVEGKDFPSQELPAGCNPRSQNIDKSIYKKIQASFEDGQDPSFCLKNKGITILAKSVTKEPMANGKTRLQVEIPDSLGNVDGHHTYNILLRGRQINPGQHVSVRILEGLPEDRVAAIAEGLNTGIQVTQKSMANLKNLLDPIHNELKGEEYYPYILFKDNEKGKSVDVKDIVSLMWVMCPSLFEGDTKKHPSWIYSKSCAVFDNGFYSAKSGKESATRVKMLQVAPVLRTIIRLYLHVDQESRKLIRRHKKFGKNDEAAKKKAYLVNLYESPSSKIPFRDPNDQTKERRLKEVYIRMLVAGARCLLEYNEEEGAYQFTVDEETLLKIVSSTLKKTLTQYAAQHKQMNCDHTKTTRSPALWDLSFANTMSARYQM